MFMYEYISTMARVAVGPLHAAIFIGFHAAKRPERTPNPRG